MLIGASCGLASRASRMQFQHVPVADGMVAAHLLAIEPPARAPQSRELERIGEVAMHLQCHIADGIATAYCERFVFVWGSAGCLGVYPHDFEFLEQPSTDRIESLTGLDRSFNRRETRPNELVEDR